MLLETGVAFVIAMLLVGTRWSFADTATDTAVLPDDPSPDETEPDVGDDDSPDDDADDDDEPNVEEGEPTVQVDVPAKPDFPPHLLMAAMQMGIPESAARGFSSSAHLESFLMQKQASNRAPVAPAAASDPFADIPDAPFKLELDDDVDPRLAAQVKAMNGHYAKQNKAMKDALRPYVQRTSQSEQESRQKAVVDFSNRFEDAVAKLPEAFHADDVLGKGPISGHANGSAAYNSRIEVARIYGALLLGHKQRSPGTPPDHAALAANAAHAVFPDVAITAERKRLSAATKKNRKGASPPSTQRALPVKGETPYERSLAAARGILDRTAARTKARSTKRNKKK